MDGVVESRDARTAAMAGGLDRLLGSIDPDVFLQQYLGQKMLYEPGTPDRWSDLFSWQELNELLNQGVVTHPQARLVSRGANVEPSLYTTQMGAQRPLDWWRVQRLMALGASLVVARLEWTNERLRTFVDRLSRALGGIAHVDAVVSCAATPGFSLHWDNAECFNVQLDGEKQWTVVAPLRPHPLTATGAFPERRDNVSTTPPPEPVNPTWIGLMKPGDLIYLPRGWWHAVMPHTQPSLHLSISVEIPTLSDFIRWYALESARLESARKPIPTWMGQQARCQQLEPWLDEVLGAMRSSLETYLDHVYTSMARPARFDLPSPAQTGYPILASDCVVRLRARPPLDCAVDGDVMTLTVNGQTIRFDTRMLDVVRRLEGSESITVRELKGDANSVLFQAFALTLLSMDLIEIARTSGS